MTMIINGTDYSALAKKNGYRVSYQKREGVNSGVMLDGSKVFDLLAWKATIVWELNGLTAAQFSGLLTACMQQYATVTFFDAASNANKTVECIPEIGESEVAFQRHGITYWRDGITITMEER